MSAQRCESAVQAVGAAGFAHIASVQYKPMMGFGDYVGRNMPSERPFGLKRCFTAGGQPDAVAYAKHVCIYSLSLIHI